VTEFIDGISLHDFENVKKKHKDVELIINRGYSAILTQVFEHGFFHADPHPGNMLVLKNGDLAFLDFGIVGRFSQELKDRTISIVYGVLNSDVDLVMREFLKFGTSSKINVYDFKRELSELFDPLILVSDLKDVELGQIISKSIDLARKYDITIPVDYILFGKTLMTIEGVGLRYDPNFNVIAITKPKLEKIFKSRYSLLSIKKNVAHDMELYGDLAKTLPEKASKILDLFGRGKIDIDIEDRDIVNLTDEMERSAGNIALGFIVAALIVGSALIMQIETQKMFYNFPLIPMIGFIFAGLLGIWIVKRTIFISVRRM
jgi:ubiquinone biosynthesis protein